MNKAITIIISLIIIELVGSLAFYIKFHSETGGIQWKYLIVQWLWFQVFVYTLPLAWIVPVQEVSGYAFKRMG